MLRAIVAIFVVCLFACAPTALAHPGTGMNAVAEAYDKVANSVAVVEVIGRETGPGPATGLAKMPGMGSGVLVTRDGHVLTAAHVVQGADAVRVRFRDGAPVKVTVLRSDPSADVAVLKMEYMPANATVAPLADSDKVRVGEAVFAVGAPRGIEQTVTVGHVSARRAPDPRLSAFWGAELFQTDAALNPGNSGGPVFNLNGEVLGIVSHIVTTTGGSEGLGFAVTSNSVRDRLLNPGAIWTGVVGHPVDGRLAELLNVPELSGILVQRVAEGSPAEKIGLRGGDVNAQIGDVSLVLGGDIILEAFGVALGGPGSLDRVREQMAKLRPSHRVEIVVLRGGTKVTLVGIWGEIVVRD